VAETLFTQAGDWLCS